MATEQFERMKEAIDDANAEEDTVLLSVVGEDQKIQIHEGSEYPDIDHQQFLSFYLKYLKENHDLDPHELTQMAIRDMHDRVSDVS
jgi:hypothetical protein